MYVYVKYPRHSKGGYDTFEPDEEPENLKFHIDLVSNDSLESTDLYINELLEAIAEVSSNLCKDVVSEIKDMTSSLLNSNASVSKKAIGAVS